MYRVEASTKTLGTKRGRPLGQVCHPRTAAGGGGLCLQRELVDR